VDLTGVQYLVVGAGISGLTVARRLREMGRRVAVVERRAWLGGLCAAYTDPDSGIEVHRHGTHVFHTTDPDVAAFLGNFTELTGYRHRVLARVGHRVYPLPINLETISRFYGIDLTPARAAGLLKILTTTLAPEEVLLPRAIDPGRPPGDATDRKRAPERREPENLRQAAIGKMGIELYEAFIEGYSRKQWGRDPAALPAALAHRIHVRTDYAVEYFPNERWQGLPGDGYQAMFRRMAKGLELHLGVEFDEVRHLVPGGCGIVWTGPLDAWFGHRLGRLPWRGVRQEIELLPTGDHQGAAVINHCDLAVPYTRVHEFRHLRPFGWSQSRRKTVIAREYPDPEAEPAYPVEPDGRMAREYRAMSAAEERVAFCGRLANYRYLDMDEAVAEALACAEDLLCRPS
jgi:UDP-galactopyranose mutase